LIITVIIVARQEGLFQEYVEYRAIFKNVSGLRPGSEVMLAGVPVGNVLNTYINPQGEIVVTFQVQKKYSDRIRKNSEATIGFVGLLGEKSLDLTPGSIKEPPIPPEGIVPSVEPFSITELAAKAAPSLQDLQKVLTNLVTITGNMLKPNSEFGQIVSSIKGIVTKINQGKGRLGLLVNNPSLYRDTADTMRQVRNLMDDVEKGKGLVGTLLKNPTLSHQAVETMAGLQASFANLHKTTENLRAAGVRLPSMAEKIDSFLDNLNRAGKGLPGLVTEGQTAFSNLNTATKAIQRSWLFRSYVPKPLEHTIRMEGEPG
ncbi:MAG TPA: MlaD family protein, partial [Desulfobaccales bacterium]|nr:MlaD family protein [Desulfobaccales bacterium]